MRLSATFIVNFDHISTTYSFSIINVINAVTDLLTVKQSGAHSYTSQVLIIWTVRWSYNFKVNSYSGNLS